MYRKAKMPDQSHCLIMELSKNAVVIQCFGDISHYHWFITTEMLRDDATMSITRLALVFKSGVP